MRPPGLRFRSTRLPALALCLAAAGLAACSTQGSTTGEHLDEGTGVTVTRSSAPLILYRDNSGVAAYARDFVNLAPLRVNRMGEYRYFLWLGIWSTVATADSTRRRDAFESITLYADGEPLALDVHSWAPESIGVSEPVYVRPAASAIDAYYSVTADQIRLLGEARDIRLVAGNSAVLTFEPWTRKHSATAGIRAFVSAVGY
jgi:hypothetical protein